jgi:hypothetical protein
MADEMLLSSLSARPSSKNTVFQFTHPNLTPL